MSSYLVGQRLFGDDFSQEEIERWFADEAEAYVDLDGAGVNEFGYMQWGAQIRVPAAAGASLAPRSRIRIGPRRGARTTSSRAGTIVESSSRYRARSELAFPAEYVQANATGDIALADAAVDLLVCFGVLHHIPNVTHVVSEFAQVLEPGG